MTPLAKPERNTASMKRADDDNEILQILDRIEKLSLRPQNPGLAYQNLENINALTTTLRQKIQPVVKVS